MALMSPTANCALRYGSSPYPSKVRPLTGTRAMLTVGPSRTLRPTDSVSWASRSPYAVACRRSHDAASAIGAGSAVAEGWLTPPVLTPAGPLVSNSFGTPSRGVAGTVRYSVLVWMPASWPIFSSSVIWATIDTARSCGVCAARVAAWACTATAAAIAVAVQAASRATVFLVTGSISSGWGGSGGQRHDGGAARGGGGGEGRTRHAARGRAHRRAGAPPARRGGAPEEAGPAGCRPPRRRRSARRTGCTPCTAASARHRSQSSCAYRSP